jgi:hypothetical protein
VDESQDADLVAFTNGHAMMAVATCMHNGVPGLVLRQSWGRIGINGEGLVCVSMAHFLKWAIDKPIVYDMGPDWKAFRGWEKWMV